MLSDEFDAKVLKLLDRIATALEGFKGPADSAPAPVEPTKVEPAKPQA